MLKTTLLPAFLRATLVTGLAPCFAVVLPQGQAPVQARPRPVPRSYGARADSLNGIPGHSFGESRSNFPELQTKGYTDLDGYAYYEARPGQETGWFGKNAGHVRTIYRFYQDKFASFDALAQGTDRVLLAEEAVYLFGKGAPQSPKTLAYGEAAVNWEGKRVQAQLLDGHNECRLIIRSKPAAAQKAAADALQIKAAAAERAAKLRAENAAAPTPRVSAPR